MNNWQLLKDKLLTKKTFLFLIVSLGVLFIIFFINKNEILYGVNNYTNNHYLKYYIDYYLNGNASNLIIDNDVIMYMENDIMKLLSAPFIYLITECSSIFEIYTIIFPLFLFYVIGNNLFDEVHNGFLRLKILKLGQKRYTSSLIVTTLIYGGLLAVIPKLLYYLLLNIFYSPGFSHTHYLKFSLLNSVAESIYTHYDAIILCCMDLLISFLFGMIIAIIVILATFLMKKKVNTFLFLIIVFLSQIVLANIIGIPMIFNYFSIYDFIGNQTVFPSYLNIIFNPIILFILLLIICIIIVKRRINDYI